MKKLLTFAVSIMLISGMAFGQSVSARGAGNPTDLVPFPNAHSGWFSLDLIRNTQTLEDDDDDINVNYLNIAPSLTYAFSQKFALKLDLDLTVAGKGLNYPVVNYDPDEEVYLVSLRKTKYSGFGINNLTVGFIFRTLDAKKGNGNNLNISLNLSPAIGKTELKTSEEEKYKIKPMPNKNMVNLDVAYSKDFNKVSVGGTVGITYVGKAQNKYTFLGERDTSKLKATMEYNFGTNIQYKDADQYALTLGINYTHHGKLQFDETSSKLQKAYGQVSTELSANVKVASNIYTNLSWQHQFDTALKDSDGKMGDLSGDLIGLGATFKF